MNKLAEFDRAYKRFGTVVGVDEAGRGSLAGPVVVAAVIIETEIDGVNDSKKLTSSQRKKLYKTLTEQARYSVGIASAEEVDIHNPLHATELAIKRALEGLKLPPSHIILVDGDHLEVPNGLLVPHGDGKSLAIAAASIIAKVIRDELMQTMKRTYPNFSFDKHKGYGTKLHLEELRKYGPTPFHRLSYAPVKKLLTDKLLDEWLAQGLISTERLEAIQGVRSLFT